MPKTNPTLSQFAKLGYVETEKGLVKAESLVEKKPEKRDNLIKELGKLVPESFVKLAEKLENKKVKNATKTVVDGVKFDSQLEAYMYSLLKGAKIEFEFQKVYVLQEKFRYGKEAVRAVTLTVDFWLPFQNMIIDTKGFANDVSPLKMKWLKRWLLDYYEYVNIELPKNKKECDVLLNRILYDM
jgi:hypothetical protein